ncbi:biopolymer transport protein [Pectobacterium atrosepticum SCRI1043]|uniref:Biopolymer transport protein n=1 Tax=Pectobacterium atrosepticum (strain SCRI 1043 / ATCC BAA-672) TaxID=218491 RepID=Q6D8P3_PECAS|nr:biopolymer transporter ExbD [Pectobacterium atrosepticum]GKV86106.1 biopolymer transporter ExbD [Pectobacterium carotovorum subsp. carotovorum]AIA69822.1 biopolymer transporter ExbD [Pectobacterium atrosepticum]AIK12734.1 Biopolymer transport protein ExbD/TolR [Pectobacterium atrosepticum]ATY89740.1 biopolymer transporter ExbD [Pectobacterium atrosepticum]KFX11898.1 biopolymer transporter ExbD [Pectobacterium atrosepticum]
MRNWNEPKKQKAHIDLVPMIDVMMFLLVFFVLISMNVIPALGLKTQLPAAGSAQQLKPQKKAIITLGAQDQLELDGQPMALSDLINTLQQQQDQQTTIIINSDKSVEVERLVAVMDTLRQGGFSSISIATRKS